jgi:hypothetical protein
MIEVRLSPSAPAANTTPDPAPHSFQFDQFVGYPPKPFASFRVFRVTPTPDFTVCRAARFFIPAMAGDHVDIARSS